MFREGIALKCPASDDQFPVYCFVVSDNDGYISRVWYAWLFLRRGKIRHRIADGRTARAVSQCRQAPA